MLLYIHIPFCDSKCFYCAFNSYVDLFYLKSDYIKALEFQLENELKNYDYEIETVFIGGGTPSCIEAFEYEKIFTIIKPYLKKDIEITTEANPNSATKEWLKSMFDLGVNRVSFGVQSFDDEKLKFLGRRHSSKIAIEALNNAKNIGFEKINCDLIYGVKEDSFEKIKRDIDIIKNLQINHISAYSLTIEEKTKFFTKNEMKIDDENLSKEIFDYLENIGFYQYEISNFAINNSFRSKHNIGYWQHKEYLGVGAGAVGYINKRRVYSKKDVKEYIKNPLEVELENLYNSDIKIEKTLLGFRSFLGVEIGLFTKSELKKIDELVEIKKLTIKNNRVFSTNFLLADELALYILE